MATKRKTKKKTTTKKKRSSVGAITKYVRAVYRSAPVLAKKRKMEAAHREYKAAVKIQKAKVKKAR